MMTRCAGKDESRRDREVSTGRLESGSEWREGRASLSFPAMVSSIVPSGPPRYTV